MSGGTGDKSRRVFSPETRDYTGNAPSDDARSLSKFDRPKSRRGMKDFSRVPSSSSSGSTRYGSSSRISIGSARPPTGSIASSHIPKTASQISLTTASGMNHLNTGSPAQTALGMTMLDRPITQHGIAGVRPGTTRGLPMTRQIQDKRYYVGLLQLKIRELSQEIATILKDIENQNKERTKLLHYDKRAKELAAELTALQGELADYNIVVDKMTSDIDKGSVGMEAKDLSLRNEHVTLEIENLFEERKMLEQTLNEMKKQLELEKTRTEQLVSNMDRNTRERYEHMSQQKTELQQKANDMQKQLDTLAKEQIRLEEEFALSPLKQEGAKLNLKIIEAEEKRNKLREEEGNKLSPEQEKEKLLQKIRQDNADVAAAEAQHAETKRKTSEMENQLEQLELDVEDTHTEKQIKYNELRKREEVIEQFMASFDQNKEDETIKLKRLEETIVERLNTISNALDIDIDFSTNEEMAIFTSVPDYDNYDSKDHDQSYKGLAREHLKLQQILNKLEVLEKKLKTETVDLKKRIDASENGVIRVESTERSKTESETKRQELIAELDLVKTQYTACEDDLGVIESTYNEMKQKLEKNDVYVQINRLENKLDALKEDSGKLQKFVQEQVQRANYDSLKERAYNLLNDYNAGLQENLKSLY